MGKKQLETHIGQPKKGRKCFIIMPITTPEEFVDRYNGDGEHFRHVLDHLFVPAVEKAGYTPVLPEAKGSELIQASIIKNLEEADLVLCDMSCLNANVFFEVGIRTALNQPVSLVRDELTVKIPFDVNSINNHTYQSELAPQADCATVGSLR